MRASWRILFLFLRLRCGGGSGPHQSAMRPENVLQQRWHCLLATGGKSSIPSIRGGSTVPSTSASEHEMCVTRRVDRERDEALQTGGVGAGPKSCNEADIDKSAAEEAEAVRAFWESSEEAGEEGRMDEGMWRPSEAYIRNASNHVLFKVCSRKAGRLPLYYLSFRTKINSCSFRTKINSVATAA